MIDGGLAWFESYRKLVVTHQIAFALIEGLDRVVQLLDRNRHSAPNGGDGPLHDTALGGPSRFIRPTSGE